MGQRSRARAALVAAFSAGVAAPLAAQTPPGAAPSPAPATPPAAGAPTAAPPAGGAAGTKAAPPAPGAAVPGAPTSSEPGASAPPKPAAPVGGYSWTDKKAARARRKRAAPAQRLDPNAPLATYPGFRMLPNGESQLVLRLTKPVNVQMRRAAGSLVFVLPGVRVGIRNNTNPLITTHFNTPLSMARLVAVKQGAELVVELREAVEPRHKVTRGPYGTTELEVLLPRAKRDYSSVSDPAAGRAQAVAPGATTGTTGRGPRRRGPEM